MSKKILVIYFTQSGQLEEIIENFTSPLEKAGHSLEKVKVEPAVPYPFPWTSKSFFAQMPDCVLHVPSPMKPFQLKETRYDLVILGYQAWFLSPCIPVNSILHDPAVAAVLKNTPVVTITGARNMWISAMEDLKKMLRERQANLVGNVVLVDNHHNFVSFVTILHWMFSGKRDRYLNIFPKPGVSDADIAHCSVYGDTVRQQLESGQWQGLQAKLVQQKAVVVKYNLMFIESKAKRIFGIWAKLIAKRKKEHPGLLHSNIIF